ncbi:MAG TPA: FAD-binding oxidoreductase [Gemmatimonadaceae bacterium]|nr:FAD-binding oxidoreductase [Gemmatimonadaceae bacterium]
MTGAAASSAPAARPAGFRGIFRDDLPARAVYSEGAGIARALPAAVAVPRDAEDVATLVRWAAETRTPLIARGSGSGMAGGAVGAGVIVDLSRLDEIGAVERGAPRGLPHAAGRVRCGPGALRGEVDARARAQGLRFPVDPSSGAFCTVGGMVATNAAGARTLRFGATRRWVAALDCVFADGTRATVHRGETPPAVPALARAREALALWLGHAAAPAHAGVRKESSGYAVADYARSHDFVDLLVGSEGTLALFAGVELALAPAAGATSSVLAAFATLEAAVDGAARAREAGASACELLDRTFLEVAAQGAPLGIPPESEAVLLIEAEGESADEAAALARRIGEECAAAGATTVELALDAATETRLWTLRHAASPILSRLDPALKSMQFIEDGCVPPERLPEYVRGVRAALAAHGIRGVIFGHAGDANVHVNPLVDVRRPDWREQVGALLGDVAALTASLGGTLSGEHGDGRLRAPLAPRVWPERAISAFAAVKRAFDPEGILNPGVKLALPGQAPLVEIKYDPALPPLPAAASEALRAVERERAYARFRLDLLESGT